MVFGLLVKCLNCNKEYDSTTYKNTNRRNTYFCSDLCLDKWNKNKNKKYGICKICGKEFKLLRRIDGCYDESKICSECKDKDLVQCQYCGKYYSNVRNEQGIRITYYCSEECNRKWNEECNTKTRICKHCGKSFIVYRNMNNYYSEDIYCSRSCMLDSLHEQSYNNEKPTVCKYCGKEFYQDRIKRKHKDGFEYYEKTNKKYCSDDCYKKACQFSYNYQAKRICANCGKEFIAKQYTEKDDITKKEPRLLGLYKKETTCSYKCFRELKGKHYKQTCQEKYGVTSCAKLDSSKQKMIITCQEKYGVNYPVFLPQAIEARENISTNSQTNKTFSDLLEKLNIKHSCEFPLGPCLFDFVISDCKCVVELNPTFTHTCIDTNAYYGKNINYHLDRTNIALQNGYRCIHVWQWDNENKVIQLLQPKTKLYARKLQIKEIIKQDTSNFINQYHLQGSCRGNSINIGLYQDNSLVQVMTFGKPRYNRNYQWELLRLCSHSSYTIVGGAEKLFSYFVKQYNPQSIISYCDISKFNGDVYERLGFKLKQQTKPAKIWSKGSEHVTDNLLRQRGFDQLIGSKLNPPEIYGKGTNNEELMLKHGWLPVYDCGQKVFVWDK